MKKISFEKIIAFAALILAVGFNLWIYRLEPTATIDPNDNTFQFALVDRTNAVWDFALEKCTQSPIGVLTFPLCHFSYLSDHWVHNWAAGYNLPYYYSHIPQIAVVAGWRFINLFVPSLTLFQFYHIVIYLLLCLIPIPVFAALRVMGTSWLTAGIGAVFATNLSTDGLYGLDPSSFLWRGYGLSSQLFAMIWLPLALAYSFRFFTSPLPNEFWKSFLRELTSGFSNLRNKRHSTGRHLASEKTLDAADKSKRASRKNVFPEFVLPAIFFVTSTTAGHLGIGMITMLSIGFLAVSIPVIGFLKHRNLHILRSQGADVLLRLVLVAGVSIFLLSYWILPTFIHGNFHNISFWDPVWKFDSYGAKETMIRLLNGDLFDFGRLPVITILTFLGMIVAFSEAGRKFFEDRFSSLAQEHADSDNPTASSGSKKIPVLRSPDLSPFGFLFIVWLFFYFGRTTWGGLIDLIPGMKDFHLSRFLVGVHVSGMLLAPIGFSWLASRIASLISRYIKTGISHSFILLFAYSLIGLFLIPPVLKWTLTYNELNDRLIVQANGNHAKVRQDEQRLFTKLRSLPPARIFAGRGGGYGKRFEVAETPYFMHLSTYGLPTSLWLPETWSMNSDTEQYFSDNLQKDYDLYNLRWVVAPPDEPPQPFWTKIDSAPTWNLYEVPTTGYFTVGVRPAIVAITKMNFVNLVHLWIQSDYHKNGLYPELTFAKGYPKTTGIPNFKMTDEVSYITPDLPAQAGGSKHNLWTQPPVYLPPGVSSVEAYKEMEDKSIKNIRLLGPESVDGQMIFKTKVEVAKNCTECIVVFKQTAHPNWKAYIDGKPAKTMIVFPFFTGVSVPEGVHTVTLSYEPSKMKQVLILAAILTSALIGFLSLRHNARK